MEHYDVFIAGGGMGGSAAARFAAAGGLKTLFVEKYRTPRHKPCSGIQFKYFEKILGMKIPRERLCNTQINRMEMHFPDGTSLGARFSVLNYMRKPFDEWLNIMAQQAGASFRDACEFLDFEEVDDGVLVTICSEGGQPERIFARYAIDATGLSSLALRKKLRPEDFEEVDSGGCINYYIDGEANLDPSTLYQFWDLRFSDAMFAWIYVKTLDDGQDYWVVGTGARSGSIPERQKCFYDFVREKYGIGGEIVMKEEYMTKINLGSRDKVWLGRGRVLMVGDAAGLVDEVRGVGQDAAALSGRLVAKAILRADQEGTRALEEYAALMKRITAQTRGNQAREIGAFETNEQLQKHLKANMLRTGVGLLVQGFLNKFRSAEKQVLLPP